MTAMNLRDLGYLNTIIKSGSLNKAADELGISQPALSKAIKRLETKLGTRLFKRHNRGMLPTTAGLAAAKRAKLLTEDAQRFSSELGSSTRRPASHMVTVGCGPSEATRLLPMAIAALQEREPAIRVTVLYGLNEDLMPMVKRGDIDFALSSVPRTATDPDLEHQVLMDDRASVVCSASHPLAGQEQLAPAMLLQYPWVLARRRELERRALDDLFLRSGLKPPEAAIETTSASLMKSLLMQGRHLSFLPREMIYWEQQAGQLVSVAVSYESWERQVGITRRRHHRSRRAAARLIASIGQTVSELT